METKKGIWTNAQPTGWECGHCGETNPRCAKCDKYLEEGDAVFCDFETGKHFCDECWEDKVLNDNPPLPNLFRRQNH